ncbi:MAG: oligosaccharide flippase family protein [Lachnospiraceae bacterium]|nr:oligosaccharide flippase family protein [Lachnospiraceae bacterium]MBQ9122268.1 oligosaccharide flippase family protein [Lachnospiraceae bacterium]
MKAHPLIKGTIMLTLTGMFSRLIGFFYRIYLSRTFGEEGMGLYQLLGPILALSFSLCGAGIQTSISKYVAGKCDILNHNPQGKRDALVFLFAGILQASALSALCSFLLYTNSEWIATHFLLEPRCASMLRIIALSIPFSALHACGNGYFYGISKTSIPSTTQLIEQFGRFGCVFVASLVANKLGLDLHINVAVVGLVLGEAFATMVSLSIVVKECALTKSYSIKHALRLQERPAFLLAKMALPLSTSRIVVNLLQSVEAVYIPNRLQSYGHTSSEALSIYGVLTGMAMPLIFFPSALTNSLSVLLLPLVARAQEEKDTEKLKRITHTAILFSSLFGILCTIFFLCISNFAGTHMFDSPLASGFIATLSFICPFLYLSSTMSSILHGLGKTGITFLLNVMALSIRLVFVFTLVPRYGIQGYLWGLLVSHLSTTLLEVWSAKRQILHNL